MKKPSLIIIGAGLSGLYAAYLLQHHYTITIIEARNRLGGRILSTPSGDDLGPTWVWAHHTYTLNLAKALNLPLFLQYDKGDTLYDSPTGVQRFSTPPAEPSARFDGGAIRLIDALYTALINVTFHFNTPVDSIRDEGEGIVVCSKNNSWEADRVVSTLPPRLLAHSIHFDPPLPHSLETELINTPTWMGSSAKALITYERAFWREEGLSGLSFSHHGILGEIHDASQQSHNALFGFIHSHRHNENAESLIIEQLVRLYGSQASNPLSIHIKDWKNDPYTSAPSDQIPLREHPNYGLTIETFGSKFIGIGTETSYREGGYIEGALLSAQKGSETLLIQNG